jgi:hypothetical protein
MPTTASDAPPSAAAPVMHAATWGPRAGFRGIERLGVDAHESRCQKLDTKGVFSFDFAGEADSYCKSVINP